MAIRVKRSDVVLCAVADARIEAPLLGVVVDIVVARLH